MFVIRHFWTKKKRLEEEKKRNFFSFGNNELLFVYLNVEYSWSREYCFSKNFSRDADDCVVCSFQRNICSLQVRLKGGQLRSMYVAFKTCPQAEKTLFNIRFHKATICNGTVLNSTHTFKYLNQ